MMPKALLRLYFAIRKFSEIYNSGTYMKLMVRAHDLGVKGAENINKKLYFEPNEELFEEIINLYNSSVLE